MEFCKTIKEFDCTKFSEHSLYYVHWHDITGKPIKAIYLCDVVDEESNSIDLKRVVPIQGNCRAHTIRFGSGDVNCIDEVQEVEFETEYDISWKEWQIRADISPQAIQEAIDSLVKKYRKE